MCSGKPLFESLFCHYSLRHAECTPLLAETVLQQELPKQTTRRQRKELDCLNLVIMKTESLLISK